MLAREEEGQTTIAVTTLLAVETRGNYDELIIISVKVAFSTGSCFRNRPKQLKRSQPRLLLNQSTKVVRIPSRFREDLKRILVVPEPTSQLQIRSGD